MDAQELNDLIQKQAQLELANRKKDAMVPQPIGGFQLPVESQQNRSYPYQTSLSLPEQLQFMPWVKANNIPFDPRPTADYDMPGFFKALVNGDPRAKSAVSSVDGQLHFPDVWKTPYHKSISSESQYAPPNAPKWVGNKLVAPNGDVVHVDLPPEDNSNYLNINQKPQGQTQPDPRIEAQEEPKFKNLKSKGYMK